MNQEQIRSAKEQWESILPYKMTDELRVLLQGDSSSHTQWEELVVSLNAFGVLRELFVFDSGLLWLKEGLNFASPVAVCHCAQRVANVLKHPASLMFSDNSPNRVYFGDLLMLLHSSDWGDVETVFRVFHDIPQEVLLTAINKSFPKIGACIDHIFGGEDIPKASFGHTIARQETMQIKIVTLWFNAKEYTFRSCRWKPSSEGADKEANVIHGMTIEEGWATVYLRLFMKDLPSFLSFFQHNYWCDAYCYAYPTPSHNIHGIEQWVQDGGSDSSWTIAHVDPVSQSWLHHKPANEEQLEQEFGGAVGSWKESADFLTSLEEGYRDWGIELESEQDINVAECRLLFLCLALMVGVDLDNLPSALMQAEKDKHKKNIWIGQKTYWM